MNNHKLLTTLTSIGPRFADNEKVAAEIIETTLKRQNIPYTTQPFTTDVPVCTHAELVAAGEPIACIGSAMVSGEIPDGKYLMSNFGYDIETPYNIVYSPLTDSISVVDYYKVPSVTISRKDVVGVVMAQTVSGEVNVERRSIETENILVGNVRDPRFVVFAHFDSIIGPGAVDNAGSVVVMMNCLTHNPDLLKTTLFIFAGNEEIAYDDYKINGYGFRVFESEHSELLAQARKVFVLDGLGMGKPTFTQHGLEWVLQLRMLDEIREKAYWLQNDQTPVLRVFHTHDDGLSLIDEGYLTAAEKLLQQELEK